VLVSARRQLLDKCAELGAKLPTFVVRRMELELRGSGLPLKPQEMAGFGAILTGAGALCGLVVTGGLSGLVILGGFGAAGPVLACKAAKNFRSGKVARQFEQAAEAMAQQVHDGTPLPAVLAQAASKLDSPLSEELGAVLAEHAVGVPLAKALERFSLRVRTSETVQIVALLQNHLETGADPLDPMRLLNFRQPFEIPEPSREPVPATFADATGQLLLLALDEFAPSELCRKHGSAELAAKVGAAAATAVARMTLPSNLAGSRDALVQAVRDEVGGLGPLEILMRLPSVDAIYILSPLDVFAATLPAELLDTQPRPGAPEAPEGYQRAKLQFHDAAHLLRDLARLLTPLGVVLDASNPAAEGVLPNGWEVAAQLTAEGTPAVGLGRVKAAG
jgi:hypothetical protein